MNATTRRKMLATLVGLGALGGVRIAIAPLRAAPALPLRLPDTPLRLARVLERGLDAGSTITVKRSWQVQFDRQARGIIVSGRQITATVSAPPHLAQLAGIEQARDTSALFPLMLSETGHNLTRGGIPALDDGIAAALHAAEALIARQPIPADERAAYGQYLALVHEAGSGQLDTLPPDLLFPTSPPVIRTEEVALPGGLKGTFTLHYTAQPQPDAPWLKHAERRITTRVEGLERSASEVWTLGPI